MSISAKKNIIWAASIADALAMPVHWFYDINMIPKVYGNWISGYIAPKDQHPTCILSISNTGWFIYGLLSASLCRERKVFHIRWTR